MGAEAVSGALVLGKRTEGSRGMATDVVPSRRRVLATVSRWEVVRALSRVERERTAAAFTPRLFPPSGWRKLPRRSPRSRTTLSERRMDPADPPPLPPSRRRFLSRLSIVLSGAIGAVA